MWWFAATSQERPQCRRCCGSAAYASKSRTGWRPRRTTCGRWRRRAARCAEPRSAAGLSTLPRPDRHAAASSGFRRCPVGFRATTTPPDASRSATGAAEGPHRYHWGRAGETCARSASSTGDGPPRPPAWQSQVDPRGHRLGGGDRHTAGSDARRAGGRHRSTRVAHGRIRRLPRHRPAASPNRLGGMSAFNQCWELSGHAPPASTLAGL